jgi:lipoate-protein ligase A
MTDPFPPYTYDDDLINATRHDGQARVRVCRLEDTTVVLGAGSDPKVELNLDACVADGVPILKRRGGGCAVVIDPGNVIVSVVMTGLPFGGHRRHFDLLSQWLSAGLARAGVPAVRKEGICDLVLGDRKIAGACLHRSKDLLYYSATLLVAPDVDKVLRYLKHPPREPDYRRGRAHVNFMGSVAAVLKGTPGRSQDPGGASSDSALAEELAGRLRRVLRPPNL